MTHHKTISTTVTSTVLLDSNTDLLVTSTGQIVPTNAGTAAVIIAARAVGDRVVNRGQITGAAGRSSKSTLSGGVGGIGIADLATASVINAGQITGGAGGASTSQPGGIGGFAILLAAGSTFGNTGTITGGLGGAGSAGGDGGVAIRAADNALIINSGVIVGGAGGSGITTNGTQIVGTGAAAIVLATGDLLFNTSTIVGGAGVESASGTAGAGLVTGLDDRIINNNSISGGFGDTYYTNGTGGGGVTMARFSYLTNNNSIFGGAADVPGLDVSSRGHGGYGLSMADGNVSNFGIIVGGAGDYGGTGLEMLAGSVVNVGDITGGNAASNLYYSENGGGPGGIGLIASGHSTIVNTGTISGGTGGFLDHGLGGAGGNAIVLSNGSELINHGYILGGGSDGSGEGAVNGAGAGMGVLLNPGGSLVNYGVIRGGDHLAPGNVGLSLSAGSNVANYGTITGGNGAYYPIGEGGPLSAGADGVDMAGGTMVCSGVVIGGAGAPNSTSSLPPYGGYGGNGGNGLTLNGGNLIAAGTFVGGAGAKGSISNGAQGDAIAVNTDNNTLILRPTAAFTGLVVANNQNDTLDFTGTAGTLTGLGAEFTGFYTVTEAAGAAWTLSGANTLATGTNLHIDGSLAVTGTLSDAATTTIAATGALSVTGSLAFLGGISNAGTILDSGQLSFEAPVTGTGQIMIAAASTLTLAATSSSQTIAFTGASSVLNLSTPATFLGAIAGLGAADTIDLLHVTATSASFAFGTLTLLDGSTTAATLHLQGDYTASSFVVISDGNGGTLLKI